VSLFDLSGKVALVTGGSRGIGAATALMLARAGADVALTYHTRKADADQVGQEIEGSGRKWTALRADLSRREDCERVVRQTVQALSRLDFFVANAGIWPPEDVTISEMDDDQWRRTLATNLDSVFYGTRAALKAMTGGGGGGRVVIVSSTAGQRGEAFHADYAATKGAIISFVKSVAVEVANQDITVNAVAPGWADTEMSMIPYQREGGRGKREIERTIPLGRVASAEDVAGPIVFLCSPLARHITGEILNVNGGSVLCG
jgi:3-oxoacyl-[acyl-carrier protein] reductase